MFGDPLPLERMRDTFLFHGVTVLFQSTVLAQSIPPVDMVQNGESLARFNLYNEIQAAVN